MCHVSGLVHSFTVLEVVAKHFNVSPVTMLSAALPDDDGKGRLIVFETKTHGQWERRIAAIGGHSFAVISPLGHWPISVTGARGIPCLVHETDKAVQIRRSGYLSSMQRFGGVNFSVGHRGRYRKKADCLISMSSEKLSAAFSAGFLFF